MRELVHISGHERGDGCVVWKRERESCEGGGRVEEGSVISHWLITKRCPAPIIFFQEFDKRSEHFRETPLLLNSCDIGSEDFWEAFLPCTVDLRLFFHLRRTF